MRVVLLLLAVLLAAPAAAANKPWASSATAARRQKLTNEFPVSAVHELAALEWAREAIPEPRSEAQRQQLFDIVRQEWETLAREGYGEAILESGAQLGAEDLHALLTQKAAPEAARDARAPDKARAHWILALINAGRRTEAGELIESLGLPHGIPRAATDVREAFDESLFKPDGADEAEFLRDLVAGRAADDPFDRYIGDGSVGLLWSAGHRSGLALRLAARYLADNGYTVPARETERDGCRFASGEMLNDEAKHIAARQPREFQRLVARERERLAEFRQRTGCVAEEGGGSAGSRLQSREEKRLPRVVSQPIAP
jgi:hypothetical protein